MQVSELGSTGPSGIFVPFRLRFEGAGTTAGFLLRGSQAGFYESFANGSANFTVDGPSVKAGTWQRVVFRFDRDTRNVKLTIGSSSASATLREATVGAGPVRVELGAARLKGDSSSWTVSFDNVTVDVVR